MSARPWDKFYYSDWRADPALGMCSLAARGLWLEMLALMHEADPRGHLLINGNPPDETQLAALARCPSDQVPILLAELEKAGVFNRRRDRVIFSRRQVRDEKRRKDGEKSAKKRWEAPKQTTTQPADTKEEKTPPNGSGNGAPKDTPPTPEARDQKPDKSSVSNDTGDPPLPSVDWDDQAALYRRAREVLGNKSGGVVTNLLASKGGNIWQARQAIEAAADAGVPSEYIGAIIRHVKGGMTDFAALERETYQ